MEKRQKIDKRSRSESLGIIAGNLDSVTWRAISQTDRNSHQIRADANTNTLPQNALSIVGPFLDDQENSRLATSNLETYKQKIKLDQAKVRNLECDCSFILTIVTQRFLRQQRIVQDPRTMRWGIDFYDQPRRSEEKHITSCPMKCLKIAFGSKAVRDLDRERHATTSSGVVIGEDIWRGRSRFVNQLLPICELMQDSKLHALTIPNPTVTSIINRQNIRLHFQSKEAEDDDDADYEQWRMHFTAHAGMQNEEEINFDVQLPHDVRSSLVPLIKLISGAFTRPPREENLEQYVTWLYSMFNAENNFKIPVICGKISETEHVSPFTRMSAYREDVGGTLEFISTPQDMKTPVDL